MYVGNIDLYKVILPIYKAHCVNSDANGTSKKNSDIFVGQFCYYDANGRIYFQVEGFPTFLHQHKK